MPSATKWLIERDLTNPVGTVSPKRPSTDAMNALSCWQGESLTRAFEVLVDTDAYIHALLSSEQSDAEAGLDLARCCAKFGVKAASLD
jgi:hypothetical protein